MIMDDHVNGEINNENEWLIEIEIIVLSTLPCTFLNSLCTLCSLMTDVKMFHLVLSSILLHGC